jgi:diguanylate cyclase (GGDEF)-like protein
VIPTSRVWDDDRAREDAPRIALVEDSGDYAVLVHEMLRDGFGPEIQVEHDVSVTAACRRLSTDGADCVLLDLSLPDAGGLEALEQLQSVVTDVPVVVLSGTEDELLALEAVQQGAQDYLVKRDAEPHLLRRAIRYAIERKRTERQLSHMALHDFLTGLPNRGLFMDRLRLALARVERADTSLGVMFLDLDRFKVVNDSLGHEVGDRVLIEVADRLGSVLRPSDTVARFGGDEFLVLAEGLGTHTDVIAIANRLQTCIAEPFHIGDRELFIGLSIGIALASSGNTDPEVLVRSADQSMYRAKQRGTLFELYSPDMHVDVLQMLDTSNELHRAIAREEFRLHYQPQVNVFTGAPVAVEALLRWQHPERGLIAPGAFIELAERTGLIMALGEWVIFEACRQLGEWQRSDKGVATLRMHVNISPRQLDEGGLVDAVAKALDTNAVAPSKLCLEITETAIAADPEHAAATLAALKELGVTLALDDFGTGYSSLSALHEYPLETLKIDRSFLAALDAGPERRQMLSALISIARALRLRTVAEGVEHEYQLRTLQELGYEEAQGYYFAPPTPPSDVLNVLSPR